MRHLGTPSERPICVLRAKLKPFDQRCAHEKYSVSGVAKGSRIFFDFIWNTEFWGITRKVFWVYQVQYRKRGKSLSPRVIGNPLEDPTLGKREDFQFETRITKVLNFDFLALRQIVSKHFFLTAIFLCRQEKNSKLKQLIACGPFFSSIKTGLIYANLTENVVTKDSFLFKWNFTSVYH